MSDGVQKQRMLNPGKRFRNAAILASSLGFLLVPQVQAFSDIQNHWGSQCIGELFQRQLVSGYPDKTFRPNATLTRAEFAVLMLNAFPEAPVKRPAINFKDVPANHWAYKAIRDAYQREFFAGYGDGTFLPSQPIPRVQAIAILGNTLTMNQPENPNEFLKTHFDDAVQIPNYAKNAIASATLGRIIVNYPNLRQLRPNQSATRGEIAASLCQALSMARTIPLEYIAGQNPFAIPPEMGGIGKFSEGLVVARINQKYGYINPKGEIAIQPQFTNATPFSEGLAAVQVRDQWGYIDKTGKMVISPQFSQQPEPFSEGLAKVVVKNQTGFINKTGQLVFTVQYPNVQHYELRNFSDGLAAVRMDFEKTGFIDKTGKFVIEPQPHEMSDFSEGLASIHVTGKYGFIDKTGKIVIEPQFSQVKSFSENLAAVVVEPQGHTAKWGYIDPTGKIVIEPQFWQVQNFSEGLAGVSTDSGWGFINRTGKVVISGQFFSPVGSGIEPVKPFFQGLSLVRVGEKAGFINSTGKFVIAPQFADGLAFSDGLAWVNFAGKWVKTLDSGNNPPETISRLEGGKWGYIRY